MSRLDLSGASWPALDLSGLARLDASPTLDLSGLARLGAGTPPHQGAAGAFFDSAAQGLGEQAGSLLRGLAVAGHAAHDMWTGSEF